MRAGRKYKTEFYSWAYINNWYPTDHQYTVFLKEKSLKDDEHLTYLRKYNAID